MLVPVPCKRPMRSCRDLASASFGCRATASVASAWGRLWQAERLPYRDTEGGKEGQRRMTVRGAATEPDGTSGLRLKQRIASDLVCCVFKSCLPAQQS